MARMLERSGEKEILQRNKDNLKIDNIDMINIDTFKNIIDNAS